MRRFIGGYLLFAIALFLGIAIMLGQNKIIAEDKNWIDYSDIRFTQIKQLSSPAEKPSVYAGNNRDCNKLKVTIKPAKINLLTPDTDPVVADDCMVQTSAGLVGGSYFLKSGTDVAGNAIFPGKRSLIAGPGFGSLLADATAPQGVYLGLMSNPLTDIETVVQSDKSVKHSIKNSANITDIKKPDGQRFMAIPETIAFSSNGDFIVFDSPGHGFVKVNTNTYETLSFGQKSNYGGGLNPGWNLAISANGRYVVTSRVGVLNIYDLNSCTTQTGINAHLMNCLVRSLNTTRTSQTGFGLAAFNVRFANPESFTYYTDDFVNGELAIRQYKVAMGEVSDYGFGYLGLGDSFASGEGSYNYKAISLNKCHLSLDSYPYVLGDFLRQEDYESIACSGAKVNDILLDTESTKTYSGQAKDGLNQSDRIKQGKLPEIISSFIPGKVTQYSFIQELRPETVTISIGGNDIGFAGKITKCVLNVQIDISPVQDTCFSTYEDRKEVAEEIYALSDKLISLYSTLKEEGRKVYVLGYPKLVNPGGNCALNVSLNYDETYFADRVTTLLNDAIEHATKQAGVVYVDVENILEGHRLCETESENTFVHGLTEDGTESDIQLASESFHPKNPAQELYQNRILSETNNFTKKMPLPESPAKMPRLQMIDQFFVDTVTTGRTIYKPIYEDFAESIVYKENQIAINLNSSTTGLGPFLTLNAEIHSTPISLGNLVTDQNGNLSATITIPGTVTPGYHTVHLYGTSQTGQPIDIYDFLFIGNSQNDFDGDGIMNSDERCVYTLPSGTDSDGDGVDEACDSLFNPQVAEPPVEETPAETEEVIVDVPIISDFGTEKDTDTNGETVAGNEQSPIEEPKNNTVAQAPTGSSATNTQTQTTSSSNNQSTQTTLADEQPQVLSESTADNNSQNRVNVPLSDSTKTSAQPAVAKDSKVYLYYLISGAIAFIGLVIFLLTAMKRQKQ